MTQPGNGNGTAPPPYKLYSVRDLLELRDDPNQWIVKNMIPRVGRVLVYGKGGDYKSSLVFDLCVAVASCGKLLERMAVVEQFGPVLLLSTEGSIYSNRDRLCAYLRSRNVVPDAVPLHYGRQPLELRKPHEVATLRSLIDAVTPKPVLLVLDPMISFYGGNENDSEQMRKFTKQIDELIDDYELSVVIVHHANKKADIRGSSVLQAWFDAVLKFETQQKVMIPGLEGAQTIITVESEKQRDGSTGTLFSAVPFFENDLQMIQFGIYDKDAKGVILSHLKLAILKRLKLTRTAMTKSQLAQEMRMGHQRIEEALAWLLECGLIEHRDVTRPTGGLRTRGNISAYAASSIGTRIDAARAILAAARRCDDGDEQELAGLGPN
jgi:hypothetical protein